MSPPRLLVLLSLLSVLEEVGEAPPPPLPFPLSRLELESLPPWVVVGPLSSLLLLLSPPCVVSVGVGPSPRLPLSEFDEDPCPPRDELLLSFEELFSLNE